MIIGKDSSRPLRPYFFRPDRTNRSRSITRTKEKKSFLTIFFSETIAPTRTGPGSLKGPVAPSTPIFFAYRSDQEEPSYNAPTRTGPRSLERTRRALYAHIFFVQIGPIGAEL
ncbi:LOW QUALITY PROTEIN: hypothetical protein V1477_006350 [Vespula maculifrons]|uniref:Uncharacterized protein n=1 Tax=Vespula maculifrons TaxID=7453 RepID=A0ABD2CL80_VESMC